MNIGVGIFVVAAAAAITYALGFILIPLLHKLKFGQTILDIGPVWHKKEKQGVPPMGGIMFIVGITAAFVGGMLILGLSGETVFEGVEGIQTFKAVSGMLMAICFGFVGFLDDFIKVRKKQNEGLTATQKIIYQVLIIAAYFTARILSGDTSTVITFPFIGQLDLWYFYYIIMGLVILYLVNAVNLTDGIDGLCSSVTLIFCAGFTIICSFFDFGELGMLSLCVCGGCVGFLFWNFHPARVFMGDTGSLFLGGAVCAIGIGAGCEVLMIIASAVYIWEALTVLIQMGYFKITHGKRLFKMTPIHHSFEIRGWSEIKIVAVFSGLEVLAAGAAVLLTRGL